MAGKHLEAGVLFQALKAEGEACRNYLAVSAALFSAARTISSASTGRESEKDCGRGTRLHGQGDVLEVRVGLRLLLSVMRNMPVQLGDSPPFYLHVVQ